MRTGMFLLQDVPWDVLRERALRADDMGFDSIWVADHLVEPYNPSAPWSEAWTLLGALAATTTRATLGALTSSQTLRNPTLLVQAVQTLRDISGGRAELALGAGGAPLDHSMTGTPAWTPQERADRFAEFVPLVSELLRTGASPEGAPDGSRHFPVEGAKLNAAGGVRLTIGALGPQSIGLAARYGDAWNSYSVKTGGRVTGMVAHEEAVGLFRARKKRFEQACEQAGRDPAAITKSYTWIESYMGAGLPELERCKAAVHDFAAEGVTEFVVYWPRDESTGTHPRDFLDILRNV